MLKSLNQNLITKRDYVLKQQKELQEILNNYKGRISKDLINYLESLIQLEISVVKDEITEEDRLFLSELSIYRYTAIYNIYNKNLNIIKSTGLPLIIEGQDSYNNRLDINTLLENNFQISIFAFDYNSSSFNQNKIPTYYNNRNIGKITIYETLESKEQRVKELDRIIEELELAYDDKGPLSPPGYIGGPRTQWFYEHTRKIDKLEQRFTELDSKKELSNLEKQEIAVTNYIKGILFDDMGLTELDFEEVEYDPFRDYNKEQTELEKTKVKKLPNLVITKKTKYI